jgi:hypothetical protein
MVIVGRVAVEKESVESYSAAGWMERTEENLSEDLRESVMLGSYVEVERSL